VCVCVCVQKSTTTTTTTTANKKKQRVSETSFFLSLFWFFPVRFKAKKEGHEKHNKKKRALTKKKRSFEQKSLASANNSNKKDKPHKKSFFRTKDLSKNHFILHFCVSTRKRTEILFLLCKKERPSPFVLPFKAFLDWVLVCCVFGEKKKLCNVFRVGLFFLFGVVPCLDFLPQAKKNEPKKEEKEKMTFQGCAVHFGRQRLFLLNLTRRKKKKVLWPKIPLSGLVSRKKKRCCFCFLLKLFFILKRKPESELFCSKDFSWNELFFGLFWK